MIKTLVVVVIITTVVYCYDPKRAEIFKRNYNKCRVEINKKLLPPSIKSFKCALYKDDKLFNDRNKLIKEEFLKFVEDIVYDDYTLREVLLLFKYYYRHELFNKRHDSNYLAAIMSSRHTEQSNRQSRHTPSSEETLHHFIIRILALLMLF